MKKLIVIVALALVIAFATTVALLGYKKQCEPEPFVVPKISEMDLHDALKTTSFGLYYYDGDTAKNVIYDDFEIDETKPMVITTHGMKDGNGYEMSIGFSGMQYWQDAGYNCFIFRWTQLADDLDPFSIERKEWSGRSSQATKFYYKGENGEKTAETVNIPQYSLAEMFVAYYNEFMTKYDMKSPEIRLMGHSMGGQLVMAIASYTKTAIDGGGMNPRYMYNRITMLDPFLSSEPNNVPIDWLDRTTGENGSAGLVIEICKEYAAMGIPVEYIHSGYADILVNAKHRKELEENTIFIRVNSAYIPGDFFSAIAPKHQVAIDWTNESMPYKYFDDTFNQNYAGAPSTPTIYVMAQHGAVYEMRKNLTEDPVDDVIYSSKLNNGVIGGYAFFDENDNGLCDDSFLNMRESVKVELYEGNRLVSTAYTNRGGYYKFSVTADLVGKNLKIKTDITPAQKAVVTGERLLWSNIINSNGESDVFTLSDIKEIKIANIGIK
jgi:pimeloyl-ACP methyl ester carboxylesterase